MEQEECCGGKENLTRLLSELLTIQREKSGLESAQKVCALFLFL